MIEGVIHHCTESGGRSTIRRFPPPSPVAFAFCRLLGFLLLPRLKAIHSQTLYRPETGKADAYADLADWSSADQSTGSWCGKHTIR